jgi:hypothetical protein
MRLTFGLAAIRRFIVGIVQFVPGIVVSCMLVAITMPAGIFAANDERPAAATPPAVNISFVESFRRDGGSVPVTAIGLRWTPAAEKAPPARVLVLVDTSASQMGDFRRSARDALAGMLETARPADRYLTAAADVACVPLGDGFVPAGDPAAKTSLTALDARTPLGSTDLIEVLDRAVELVGETPAAAPAGGRSIVYIGDGPGLGGIDPGDFQRILETLRGKHITFSAIGIGPPVNWPCLAARASASPASWLPGSWTPQSRTCTPAIRWQAIPRRLPSARRASATANDD